MPFALRRLGYALGAEVRGIDLARPLDDETIGQLRKAWIDNMLLCFPDQSLNADQLAEFSSRFGELERWRSDLDSSSGDAYSRNTDRANKHVTVLSNKPVDGKPWDGYKEGQSWHTDRSYKVNPMPAAFLHAKEVPEAGGDTMFANQYMAYETLSPALQRTLEGLSAVHDYGNTKNAAQQSAEVYAQFRQSSPPVVHPVAILHPESKRKALYVGGRVIHFEGMTAEESRPLIDFLNRHAVRYEFTYRHRWRAGDLVMWDNRCLLHVALCDYDQQREARHMIRTNLRGPVVGRPLAGAV